jgi:hypothetical protein
MDSVVFVAVAAVVGALAGGMFVHLWGRGRQDAQLVARLHAVNTQYAALVKDLRATNTRLMLERERDRLSLPQHLAAAVSDQRTIVSRLEAQLKFAYQELDRLRGSRSAWEGHDGADHAFAPTQTFDDLP